MARIVIGDSDESLPGTVEVEVDGEVVVELGENRTTGFEWDAVLAPAAVLDLVRSDFDPPSGAGVGAAGRRRFMLVARRAGKATLTMELRRPWEGGKPPRRSVAVQIEVRVNM